MVMTRRSNGPRGTPPSLGACLAGMSGMTNHLAAAVVVGLALMGSASASAQSTVVANARSPFAATMQLPLGGSPAPRGKPLTLVGCVPGGAASAVRPGLLPAP